MVWKHDFYNKPSIAEVYASERKIITKGIFILQKT